MFCPNCGAKNDEKQNYCRFCGLNLQSTAKSLTTQIIHGENSDSLKKMRAVKRTVDFASALLVGVWIAAVVADIFFRIEFSKDLLIISLGLFILFQIIQAAVGYFQRNDETESKTKKFKPNEVEHFEAKETGKLLEERPFEPVASVTENSTELFPIENKTRKFE